MARPIQTTAASAPSHPPAAPAPRCPLCDVPAGEFHRLRCPHTWLRWPFPLLPLLLLFSVVGLVAVVETRAGFDAWLLSQLPR